MHKGNYLKNKVMLSNQNLYCVTVVCPNVDFATDFNIINFFEGKIVRFILGNISAEHAMCQTKSCFIHHNIDLQ